MTLLKLISMCALLLPGCWCGAETWYVRPDGGDRSQCTGQADAAYPGTGTSQACAFRHPYFLFVADRQYGEKPRWLIVGGDTVIIKNGQYRIGYKGPEERDYWQFCPGDPFACGMPPIPSGVPGRHTRLLGEDYQHCTNKPVLFGGYGAHYVISLVGSSYVDVECLEITDHGSCAHAGMVNGCRTNYPLSDYASNGIVTSLTTHDILLQDLNIHGLAQNGILGSVGDSVTAKGVRIAGNSSAGWNFDDGKSTASRGSIILMDVTVEWNGCSEEYPIVHSLPYDNCSDDNSAGYGDGIGTPDSAGWNWTIDHSVFRYNTQDGLDLLHLHGANSSVMITNSRFSGNMGNQVKLGAVRSSVFRNNIVIGNCRYLSLPHPQLPARYNRNLSDFCRAGGNAFLKQMQNGERDLIQNNSFAGMNGAPVYLDDCASGRGACPTAAVRFDNNLIIGFPDYSRQNSVYVPALDSAEPTNYFSQENGSRRNNLMFQTRSANPIACGGAGSTGEVCNGDPKLIAETDIDTLDFHLGPGSPARAAGIAIPDIETDIAGIPRRSREYDVGAYAYTGQVERSAVRKSEKRSGAQSPATSQAVGRKKEKR
jgi:hypothetical protein